MTPLSPLPEPPRPALPDRRPFTPQQARARTPRPVTLAVGAEWVAAALGLVAAGLARSHGAQRQADLRHDLLTRNPGQHPAVVSSVVTHALTAAVIVVVVLALAQALVALVLWRRHRWAAAALVALGLLQLASLAVVPSLLAGPGWRSPTRGALAGQAVIVALAVAAVLTRSARSWLRR